jgi:NTE family protein
MGGEWLTDLQVGDNPLIYTEFYQPVFAARRYFVSPHADFELRNVKVVDAADRTNEYRVRESSVGIDVGRELGNWGEWRVGVFTGDSSSRVRIGDTSLPQTNFDSGGYFARISYDRLDSVFFPREGQQASVEWTGQRRDIGSDRHSDRVEVGFTLARSRGKSTLIFSANAGSTVDSEPFPEDFFPLGGFLNLSGLGANALSGPHFGVGRLIFYRKIGSGGAGVFDVPLYAGVSFEAGNVWQDRNDASFSDLRNNGSVFVGADTILGPVYLGGGYDEKGESAFYLYLGRTF